MKSWVAIEVNREAKVECTLCGAECECMCCGNALPIVIVGTNVFEKLQELLGDIYYIDFDLLNFLEKTSYVLGSILWEDDFSSSLSIVKEFIVNVWESRLCMSWPPA